MMESQFDEINAKIEEKQTLLEQERLQRKMEKLAFTQAAKAFDMEREEFLNEK